MNTLYSIDGILYEEIIQPDESNSKALKLGSIYALGKSLSNSRKMTYRLHMNSSKRWLLARTTDAYHQKAFGGRDTFTYKEMADMLDSAYIKLEKYILPEDIKEPLLDTGIEVHQAIELGEVYTHFKGKDYKTLHFAENTENGNLEVVYIALYGDYKIYTRPLAMFASKVERNNYSGWRFTKKDLAKEKL